MCSPVVGLSHAFESLLAGCIPTRHHLRVKYPLYKIRYRKRERCSSSCHKYGTRQKFWLPMRNWTLELQISHPDALPQSHWDSEVRKAQYEVHIWHTAIFLFYLQNMMPLTLLIRVIYRTHIFCELCNGLAHHEVSVAQW